MRNIARTCRCPDVQARVCRRRIKDRQTYPAPLRAGGLAKRLWSAGLPSGRNGGRQNWKNQRRRESKNELHRFGWHDKSERKKSTGSGNVELIMSNVGLARCACASGGEVGADAFA